MNRMKNNTKSRAEGTNGPRHTGTAADQIDARDAAVREKEEQDGEWCDGDAGEHIQWHSETK